MLAPFGYRKIQVQDGAKKRPKLELDPPADAVVRRMFDMALRGSSTSASPRPSTQTVFNFLCIAELASTVPGGFELIMHGEAGLGGGVGKGERPGHAQ